MVIVDLARVWRFVHDATGVPMSTAMKCLGLERDGRLVAGVLYDAWNGVNMWMHSAITPGAYLGREYPWYVFHYPFNEVGVQRLTGLVEVSNRDALRFNERLGFKAEALLRGAASDGGDAVIMVMTRENCRWLRRTPSMAPSGLLSQRAPGTPTTATARTGEHHRQEIVGCRGT
jgi:hypothetical protein